jgi:hypothetical protein
MYAKIRPRRSTATEWSVINPVLQEGEWGVEFPDTGIGTGLCKFKIGDGFTQWNDLAYSFDAAAANAIYGGTVYISHDICLRSGTSDDWETANPVLKLGEAVFDITKSAFKCGDGEHSFTQLNYIGYNWEMDQEYDFGDIDDGEIVPTIDDKDYDFGDLDEL